MRLLEAAGRERDRLALPHQLVGSLRRVRMVGPDHPAKAAAAVRVATISATAAVVAAAAVVATVRLVAKVAVVRSRCC